jgi:hypothetical protein
LRKVVANRLLWLWRRNGEFINGFVGRGI